MAVGIKVKYYWYQIGSASFLYSFFSTIAHNLEEGKWGSKYPIIMNDFYYGHLSAAQVEIALDEIEHIADKLRDLPVSNLVWDFEDLSKQPPWGDSISPSLRNLADYFVTSDGKNLLSVIVHALEKAKELKDDAEIVSL